jgi:hypothetical protein
MSSTQSGSENASSRVRLPPASTIAQNKSTASPRQSAPPASQPGYPLQFGLTESYQTAPFNSLAIVALIVAFVLPPLGIILGHISLGQIRGTSQRGYGIGLAGTLVGYTLTILGGALFVIFAMFVGFGALVQS